jgi:hypothetical protein
MPQSVHSPSSDSCIYTCPTRGANSILVATKQNYACGRVNHVDIEEAQDAPDVVLGMFFIDATFVVVLFDSGASHSFISGAYV